MRCRAWINGHYCHGEMKPGLVIQDVLGRMDGQPAQNGDTIGPNGNTALHTNNMKCEKCGHTTSDIFPTS